MKIEPLTDAEKRKLVDCAKKGIAPSQELFDKVTAGMRQLQRKKVNTIFSPWEFIGHRVLKALDEWGKLASIQPELPITSCEIVVILVVAVNPPGLLDCAKKNLKASEFVRLIAHCHRTKPKLTKRLMALIKERWNDQRSIQKTVSRYLTESLWNEPPVWQDGRRIRQGTLRINLQDTELQAMLAKQCKVFTVNPEADTVKKARKRIKPPSWRLKISPALLEALRELNRQGFYTGHGLK